MSTSMNKGKTISIIGCGWLGLPLGKLLKENGYTVKGSTTRTEKLPVLASKGIEPFLIKVGNVLEGENLNSFFQSDILIINIPPGRRRSDVETAHPKEIETIIDAAKKGANKKIVFISSIGVYGNSNAIVKEEDAPNPESSSGKALEQIESFLLHETNFETTILRMAGLVGGDRKAGRFLAGKKEVKNGAAPVNLVHRDDCIQIIFQVLNQSLWNEVLNVCADEHPTRKAFYTSQANKQGFEPPQFTANEETSFKIISNEKLKRTLDYTFIHPDPMRF